MITLDQATQDAFARREVRIIPRLTVATPIVGASQEIPASAIISRPARSASPVVSRTPVVRMDVELAATDTVKELVTYRKTIEYQETVNGQTFDMFGGTIEHIEGGWTVKDGAIIETLRVTCYSNSQKLKNLDFEVINRASTDGPSGSQIVALTPVLGTFVGVMAKASSGNDLTNLDNAWSPNAAGPSGYGGASIVLMDGTVKTLNTHFKLVATPTVGIEVQWLSGAPATGTRYTLTCPYVIGFVVPDSPTYYTTTTPATMSPYKLKTAASNPIDVEYGIAMVPQTNLARKATFSPYLSAPVIMYRANSGTGAATAYQSTYPNNAPDWTVNYEQGFVSFYTEATATENHLIFSDNAFAATDILFVGAKDLVWPNAASSTNQVEEKLEDLYGIILQSTDFEATGIALGDYRMVGLKGDEVLRQYRENLPPNYIIYDAPDGTTKGKAITQALTPDFTLTQVKGLKDREVPQDVYTCVRVISSIGADYEPVKTDTTNYVGSWPATPTTPTDWTNSYNIWDGSNTTYATLAVATSRIVLKSKGNANIYEKLKSITVKFEGQLTVYRVPDIYCDSNTLIGDSDLSSYIQPFASYQVATGRASSDGSITINIEDISEQAVGDRHPESFILEFTTWSGCPTCLLHNIETVVDIYTIGSAFLGDVAPYDGTTSLVDISPVAGTTGYASYYTYLKLVPESVLLGWMLYPLTITQRTALGSDPDLFIWLWYTHRVYTITTLPSLTPRRACEIALEYLEDFYRRAVIQEVDVISEPQFEIGDTIQIDDPATGESILRTIVGYRDSNSWTEPTTTLELANYA